MNTLHSNHYSLGVIGYPLGHSLSPRLHEAALCASSLMGEYRLYPIPPLPDGEDRLEALMVSLREGCLDGLNVTIPHKQSVIPYLDEMTALARHVGAVNTIYHRGCALVGDNTDAPGFMVDLQKHFSQAGSPQAALVLGGGGAARAVVYALLTSGWSVTIAARRPEIAQEIVDSFSFINQPCEVIRWGSLAEYILNLECLPRESSETSSSSRYGDHDPLALIVNATPIGMAPDFLHSPWPIDLPFPRDTFVYDLVYNPVDTALVRAARKAGLKAVSGMGMLIEQAALAFECWTGIYPSIDAMQRGVVTNTRAMRNR